EYAEEGREAHRSAAGVAEAVAQLPVDTIPRLVEGLAPTARDDLVDADGEHLPDVSAAHLDRAEERVARVHAGVGPLELLVRAEPPRRVGQREADGVARIDGENRRQFSRERSVQPRGPERQLVDHVDAAVAAMPSASATVAVKPRSALAFVVSRTLRSASPARSEP